MTKKDINEMIDQEFEEFEQDRNRRKNLKTLVSFKRTSIEYNEKSITFDDSPKMKKQLNTSIYIKTKNDNKNQLF